MHTYIHTNSRLVDTLRPFPGMHHLDVAGGTGDVAFRVLRAIRNAEARSGQQPTPSRPPPSSASYQGSTRPQPEESVSPLTPPPPSEQTGFEQAGSVAEGKKL